MLSNRHEAFRYDFSPPLQCQFNLALENDSNAVSHFGNAEIHNISPHGLMFKTDLRIPIDWDMIRVGIKFTLLEAEIMVSGHLRWKKVHAMGFMYGVHLDNDDKMQEEIITQLKKFSRKKHNMPLE